MKPAKIISCLVAIIAAVVLVVGKNWPAYSSFQVGAPVFEVQAAQPDANLRLGSIALHKGTYYVLNVQSDALAPFGLLFTYQDHTTSKVLIDDPRLIGPSRTFASVIKAERDDPAAEVTIVRQSELLPGTIKFREVSVSVLNPHLYIWRRVARSCTILVFLVATLYAFLGGRREQAAEPMEPEAAERVPKPRWGALFWTSRSAGCWAALLLLTGAGFDAFFIRDAHRHLITKTFHTSIKGWDGSFYYFWLRSVMLDGDVDFTNDLLYCDSMPPDYRLEIIQKTPRTATGLIPDKYPIGWSLLEAPWYIAADLTAQVINWCGGKLPYDGWGPVYQVFLVIGQIVYATASIYFSWRILQEYFSPALAACGVVLGWLGAPLFFYQTIDVSMSHNVMFFAVTSSYYFAYRLRAQPEKLRLWFLVGLFSAFVILARYQGAIMLLFPGIVCLQEVGKNFRRVLGLMVGTIAGALPLSLQMLAWKVMYGSFFLYTYQHETFSWLHPHLFEVLFSPFHGLFNWHPMMLIGFAGFFAWAASCRRYTEAICFTLSLLAMTYLNAAWDDWWFGASFGSRPFDACTFFSMIGIGFLLSVMVRRPLRFQVAAAALLVVALWNMNLVWMSRKNLLPFEKPVTWKERIQMSVTYWSHPERWSDSSLTYN